MQQASEGQPKASRRERRARIASAMRDQRKRARHTCRLDTEADAEGVTWPIGLTIDQMHAIHVAIGEPACPRCPWCDRRARAGLGPERVGLAGVEAARGMWRGILERELRKRSQMGGVAALLVFVGSLQGGRRAR